MLQRLLTIFLVLSGIHFAGGTGAFAAENQKQETTIRLRSCLRANKPLKEAIKVENALSVRARVPRVFKSCSLRVPDAAGTSPGAHLYSIEQSASGQEGAGSAYIRGLIYPFHFFR